MIQVDMINEVIDLNKILTGLNPSEHGAQIIFSGAVRNHNEGKKVLAVSYDAHQVLAKNIFQQISEEAQNKWGPDLSIYLVHRLGRLEVGEVSVVIIVSSRHRDASFQGSRYLIEQLKIRAPIWKKEHYAEGDSEWLQGHALGEQKATS
ncbi:MAG: molybdenum cofactor biosynthesis protein MoaE [Bdellovibrio sp.]|nr:molybdenum cofactor biosynthesis protein MoaE [Bdellovibrio sp.]